MKRSDNSNSQNPEFVKPTQKPPKRPKIKSLPKQPQNNNGQQPQNNNGQQQPQKESLTTTTKPTSTLPKPASSVPPKPTPKSTSSKPTTTKKNFDINDYLIDERPASTVPPPSGVGGHPARVLKRVKYHFPKVHEKMVYVATELKTNNLKMILMETTKDLDNLEEFVGTSVSIFSRRHIPVIQGMEYFVCDRGVGMEFFLFICEEGVFIIDKKCSFYSLECTGFDVFSKEKGMSTLLEGEFVQDINTKRTVYYITDVIQVNGKYCANLNFMNRLNEVINVIDATRAAKSSPFEINKKRFYPKDQLPKLIHENLKKSSDHSWYYRDEKRYHKAGGLLFKPNEPYPLDQSSKHTFKWKFQNSVYFSTKKINSRWVLNVATEYGETEFRQIQFQNEDEYRLMQDIQKFAISGNQLIIIECVYDCLHAEWRYIGLKSLRQGPSKVRDVLETMTRMAEGVTEKELSERIPKGTADEWVKNHAKSW